MLDGGSLVPTVLNMLEDVPCQCPIIKDLIMNVSVSHVLKGPRYLLFNPLAAQRCVTQTGVLSLSLSGTGRGNLSIIVKGLPAVLEGMGRLVCLRGYTKTMTYLPIH